MYHFFNRPMRKCFWNTTKTHNQRIQVERLVWSFLRVFLLSLLLLLLLFFYRSLFAQAWPHRYLIFQAFTTHIGYVESDLKTYKLRYHKSETPTHTHASNNFSRSFPLFHCLFGILLVFENAPFTQHKQHSPLKFRWAKKKNMELYTTEERETRRIVYTIV